jgi:hypothetical protein
LSFKTQRVASVNPRFLSSCSAAAKSARPTPLPQQGGYVYSPISPVDCAASASRLRDAEIQPSAVSPCSAIQMGSSAASGIRRQPAWRRSTVRERRYSSGTIPRQATRHASTWIVAIRKASSAKARYMISSSSRTATFSGPPSLRLRSSASITASARSRIERRNLLLSFRNRR